jgi:hypothetical protein
MAASYELAVYFWKRMGKARKRVPGGWMVSMYSVCELKEKDVERYMQGTASPSIFGAVSILPFSFNLSSRLLSSTRDPSLLPPAYSAGHLPLANESAHSDIHVAASHNAGLDGRFF